MRWKHLGRGVALVAAAALLFAACGGDDDDDEGRSTTTTTQVAGSSTSTTAGSDGSSTTAPSTSTTTASSGQPSAQCAETQSWGTNGLSADTMTQDELYKVRVGQHGCYDRVVFDINGVVPGAATVGYNMSYANGEVSADASGEPVPTAGNAALQVVIRAPFLGDGNSGHQPGRPVPRVGDDFQGAAQLGNWASLKQVTFAGSFEGQTTIAVGVADRLPFRVGVIERDGYTHVYVDVAHPS